jgi:23S rRNA pseudouridine2457 synthase
MMIIAFHKPYGILSQFTPDGSKYGTLSQFHFPPEIYPLGRLDADSEGLLLLSDEKGLNSALLHPQHAHMRTYWVQVEGAIHQQALDILSAGNISIQHYHTLPCTTRLLQSEEISQIAPRSTPIRYRAHIPESWIEIQLMEGKNRQVRRMTAAVGFPTLRLIRMAIGPLELGDLQPGLWKELNAEQTQLFYMWLQNSPNKSDKSNGVFILSGIDRKAEISSAAGRGKKTSEGPAHKPRGKNFNQQWKRSDSPGPKKRRS